MSDDDYGTESSEGWKSIRKELDALKEANKAKDAELAKFQAAQNEAAVKAVLKAKGLPEKVAGFYSGDASEDAVSKWLDENADVFGGTPGNGGGNPAPDPNALAAARLAAASGGSGGNDEPALGANRRVYGDPTELAAKVNGNQRLPYAELVRLGIMPDPASDPFRRPATD